jgi:hypothetical protein
MVNARNKKRELGLLEEYKKAFREIVAEEEREGFLIHFFIYLFVIAETFLYLLINKKLNTASLEYLGIIFVGWTLAILIHYFEAFKWSIEHIEKKEELAELRIKRKFKNKEEKEEEE